MLPEVQVHYANSLLIICYVHNCYANEYVRMFQAPTFPNAEYSDGVGKEKTPSQLIISLDTQKNKTPSKSKNQC